MVKYESFFDIKDVMDLKIMSEEIHARNLLGKRTGNIEGCVGFYVRNEKTVENHLVTYKQSMNESFVKSFWFYGLRPIIEFLIYELEIPTIDKPTVVDDVYNMIYPLHKVEDGKWKI